MVVVHAGPSKSLVDHVHLGSRVVGARDAAGVVAVVHVFAPHALPQLGGFVVKIGDALVEGALRGDEGGGEVFELREKVDGRSRRAEGGGGTRGGAVAEARIRCYAA